MVLESSNAQTGECILVWGTLGLSRARGSLGAEIWCWSQGQKEKHAWAALAPCHRLARAFVLDFRNLCSSEHMQMVTWLQCYSKRIKKGRVDLYRSWDSALKGFLDICLLIQSWATVLTSNCPASYKMWLGGCWALCIHLHTLNVAFFPTCQVRVVRFYFGLLRRLLLLLLFLLLRLLRRRAVSPLPDLNRDSLRSVFPAGPQPRLSALSVPCRTSTATPWFSVPCRTSTATICRTSTAR